MFAIEGELLPFDKELVLDAASWDLSQCAVDLSDFRFNDTSKTFEFDVQGSKVVYAFKGEQQLDLNLLAGGLDGNGPDSMAGQGIAATGCSARGKSRMAPALCSPAIDAQGIRPCIAGAGEVHPGPQAG